MNTRFLKVLCVLACVACAALGAAEVAALGDWPGWRGPNRDDVSTETGLLKSWPAEGPPLAFKASGLGSGFSSVSIVGQRIYTMGDLGDSSYILALNLKDGSQVWKAKVGKTGGGGGYPGTRCTPTVDGGLVFATGQYGDIVCAKVADGSEVWRKDMTKDFGGKMMSGWGYAESPLVDGPLLICTPGGPKGTLVALDKTTGAVKWRCGEVTDSAAYSSPIAADIGGVHQYIQLTDKSVFGADAATGKELWSAPRAGRTAVIPTPIYYDNFVFVTSGYGVGCNGFKITANGGKFTAEQVYESKAIADHHGGVVRIGDYIYGHSDGGGWTCLEMKTGKVKWQNKGVGKGSVTYADGNLYTRSEGTGEVAIVEASPDGYKQEGSLKQPDRSPAKAWPHPVVAGGKLYIRDQDNLFVYDVKAH